MPKLPIDGPIAKGDDFFGRSRELRRLWSLLDSGHVLLLAPRRVGKSSILARMAVDATEHDFATFQQSVAGCQDELTLVRDLYRAVLEVDGTIIQKLGNKPWATNFARFLPKAATLGPVAFTFDEAAAAPWRDLGEALIRVLSEHQDKKYLFLIDELPLFVLNLLQQDPARARAFLEWFRGVRQRLDNVRWLLAGSVGLDSITRAAGLTSTINDLQAMHLGEFSPQDADGFITQATERAGFELDPPTRAYLLGRVGWPIPFFLAHFIRELDDIRRDGGELDTHSVDTAFGRLVSVEQRVIYAHWEERLAQQFIQAHADLAHDLLDTIAVDPLGPTEEALFVTMVDEKQVAACRMVMNDLLSDGYIVCAEDGRWKFRSPMLHAYWKKFARRGNRV